MNNSLKTIKKELEDLEHELRFEPNRKSIKAQEIVIKINNLKRKLKVDDMVPGKDFGKYRSPVKESISKRLENLTLKKDYKVGLREYLTKLGWSKEKIDRYENEKNMDNFSVDE